MDFRGRGGDQVLGLAASGLARARGLGQGNDRRRTTACRRPAQRRATAFAGGGRRRHSGLPADEAAMLWATSDRAGAPSVIRAWSREYRWRWLPRRRWSAVSVAVAAAASVAVAVVVAVVAVAVGRRSDITLKHDIVLLGHLRMVLATIGSAITAATVLYVGVMAQEVQTVMPKAVMRDRDGSLRVFTTGSAIKFQTYEQWIASGADDVPMTASDALDEHNGSCLADDRGASLRSASIARAQQLSRHPMRLPVRWPAQPRLVNEGPRDRAGSGRRRHCFVG